jgi:hypothetical protein
MKIIFFFCRTYSLLRNTVQASAFERQGEEYGLIIHSLLRGKREGDEGEGGRPLHPQPEGHTHGG